jgi:hypothetical protein
MMHSVGKRFAGEHSLQHPSRQHMHNLPFSPAETVDAVAPVIIPRVAQVARPSGVHVAPAAFATVIIIINARPAYLHHRGGRPAGTNPGTRRQPRRAPVSM